MDTAVKCYLCGAEVTPFYSLPDEASRTERFIIGKCPRCRLLQLTNPPEKLEPYYAGYDPHSRYLSQMKPQTRFLLRALFFLYTRFKLLQFKEWIFGICTTKRSGTILDYGCGSGLHLSLLNPRKWQKYGADLFAPDAKFKIHNTGIHYTNLANELLPENISFDVIRLNHVLEHFKDPAKVLLGLKPLLDASGEIIIAVPNGDSLSYKLKSYGLWDAPRHLYWFNADNLSRLLTKIGYRITDIRKASSTGLVYGIICRTNKRLHPLASLLSLLISPLLLLLIGESDAIHIYARRDPEKHHPDGS